MHLNSSKNLAGPSGRWIPQELSPALVADGILHPMNMAYNMSVQTGEEFSKEFIQDRATSRIVSAMPGTELRYEKEIKNHGGQNCQVAYVELTQLLGLTRMDSQCSSDMSDFASAKGSTAEVDNESHINNSYGNCKHDDAGLKGSKKASCDVRNDPPISEPRARAPPLCKSESSNSLRSSGLEASDHSQSGKVKFLCSFGGKILPRPSDGKLRYVGGDTRILSMGRNTSLAELMKKTSGICNQPYAIKYQLPGEDLDALISVASDEDLQNMIEEYYGLESLGGSQRLRIFLIPLCESENSCVPDPSTIQQNNPEFQYVVAVNGIVGVDPSPSMNCNATGEANHNLSDMGKVASFEKDRFVSPHSFQIIDGSVVPCASQNTKESQKSIQEPNLLPSFSPVLEFPRDLNNDHMALARNETSHISTESSILLNTAELPPQNSNTSNSVNFYCTPMLENFISVPNPVQNVGLPVSSQPSDLLSHSRRPSGDTVPPSLFEQIDPSFEKCSFSGSLPSERMFHSEKPLSVSDATMDTLLTSIDSAGPCHGMPHAASDSRLQDYVGGARYCSQEGTSPSSPLSFPTTCLPGQIEMAAQEEKQSKLQQQNSSFLAPQLQIKALNVEPAISDWGLDFSNPPFGSQPLSKTEHCNNKIHCNVEKCQNSVEDKKGNKPAMKNLEENYTSCLTLRYYDANGEHLHNNGKIWEGKPPEPLFCSSSNGAETGLQVCGSVVPPSVPNDIKPPISSMMEHRWNHYQEKTLDSTGRDELASNPSWINIDSMVKTSKGLLHDENFQHANGLVPCEPVIQHSNLKHADPNKTIITCATINPSVAVDEVGSNLIFDDPALFKSSTENATFSNGIFLLEDQFDQFMDKKDKKLGYGEGSKEMEKPPNVTQKRIEPKRQEQSNIVKGMDSVISTGVESSFETIQHIASDTVAVEVPTAMATKIERAVQDLLSEVDFLSPMSNSFLLFV